MLTILIDDDLHDLHDLRARFLVFIHSLLESLSASGVSVGYLCLSFEDVLKAHLFPDSGFLCPGALEFTNMSSLRFASRSECVQGEERRHRSLSKCKAWKKVCTSVTLADTTIPTYDQR